MAKKFESFEDKLQFMQNYLYSLSKVLKEKRLTTLWFGKSRELITNQHRNISNPDQLEDEVGNHLKPLYTSIINYFQSQKSLYFKDTLQKEILIFNRK